MYCLLPLLCSAVPTVCLQFDIIIISNIVNNKCRKAKVSPVDTLFPSFRKRLCFSVLTGLKLISANRPLMTRCV